MGVSLTCVLRRYCKFIAFVMFLVYVGGLIVLFSYCVMLCPDVKFARLPLILFGVFLSGRMTVVSSYAYGILYSSSTVLLASFLLFIVLLCVVEIIDYSGGIIK